MERIKALVRVTEILSKPYIHQSQALDLQDKKLIKGFYKRSLNDCYKFEGGLKSKSAPGYERKKSNVSSVFLRKMSTKKKDSGDHLAVLDSEILGKQNESNHLSIIDRLRSRAGS